ncbi:MAG: DUF4238 domain-containing protein [Syntrophales bacterium]|nr:DUF4238 domain-containing protein [Syntrophales bacterium]MDD5641458.1 DUF4238 domain-containing protein [Syntrophales bacterium]
MTQPKRHHYLPKFYLEYFCKDGNLCVFDRKTKEFRNQTPVNTALKSNYYSFKDSEGKKLTDIEQLLSQIEGNAKNVFEKAINNEDITAEEKEHPSLFIAFMMNRVPDFEKSVNKVYEHTIKSTLKMIYSDEKRVQTTLDEFEKEHGEKLGLSAEELVEFHKGDNIKVIIDRIKSLQLMIDISFKIFHFFTQMDWLFLHAPQETSFITSDNPVVLVPPEDFPKGPYGIGILFKGVRKLFPISQTTCLIMLDHGDLLAHHKTDKQTVRNINLNVALYTERFLIGRDELLIKNIVRKTKINQWDYKGRISIN